MKYLYLLLIFMFGIAASPTPSIPSLFLGTTVLIEPASVVSPSPSPTVTSSGNPVYPAAGWVPFTQGPLVTTVASMYGPNPLTSCNITYTAPSGYPNQLGSTCLLSSSSNVISHLWGAFGNSPGNFFNRIGNSSDYQTAYANHGDYGEQGAYFESYVGSSDPFYTTDNTYCQYGSINCILGSLHIPVGAVPETGSDHHMVIRDHQTGHDYHFWQAFEQCPPGGGAYNGACTLQSGTGGNVHIGTGGMSNTSDMINEGLGIPATGGKMSEAYSIRAQDVLAGRIPHAVIFYISCDTSYNGNASAAFVYPVVPYNGAAGDGNFYCGNGSAPYQYPDTSTGSDYNITYGNHLWLDAAPNPALRGTSNCDILSYAVLKMLNEFGAYANDVTTNQQQPAFFVYAPDINDTYSSNPNGTHSYWTDVLNMVDSEVGSGGPGNSGYIANWHLKNCGMNMSSQLHLLIPPIGS